MREPFRMIRYLPSKIILKYSWILIFWLKIETLTVISSSISTIVFFGTKIEYIDLFIR